MYLVDNILLQVLSENSTLDRSVCMIVYPVSGLEPRRDSDVWCIMIKIRGLRSNGLSSLTLPITGLESGTTFRSTLVRLHFPITF